MTKTNRTIKETVLRYIVLLFGVLFLAIGIVFSVRANLGTSPISSLPYTVSLISPLTIGNATIILHVLFIAAQLAIRRKKFDPKQLIGVPAAIALGYFTDGVMAITNWIVPQNYLQQWIFCVIGIVFCALGASLDVTAKVVMLPSDGLTVTLAECAKMKYGYMKAIFDCGHVAVSAALGLIFLHEVAGIREGTVAAAILVGLLARLINKLLIPLDNKLTGISNPEEKI